MIYNLIINIVLLVRHEINFRADHVTNLLYHVTNLLLFAL
jgi:hypothetical protein